jgi:hypothetical protein
METERMLTEFPGGVQMSVRLFLCDMKLLEEAGEAV